MAVPVLLGLVACGPRSESPAIVFESARDVSGLDATNANGTANLWRMNPDGTGLVPITSATAAGATSSFPRWSPRGRVVAFMSLRRLDGADAANATSNVWRVGADGSGLAPLTKATAAGAGSIFPEWSPDGTQLVFRSRRCVDGTDAAGTAENVWRVNSDGSNLVPLTKLTAPGTYALNPKWSPDGRHIAFYSNRRLDGGDATNANEVPNIWVMNADGTGARPLTTATEMGSGSGNPVWSPDGTMLAFDHTDALVNNIWVVRADGTGLEPLTTTTAAGADSGGVSWSPDGRLIAFHSRRNPDGSDTAVTGNNVWAVNVDGTGLRPLTRGAAQGTDSYGPSWSGDGRFLLFTSRSRLDGADAASANGTYNIWRVGPDGSGLAPLTDVTAAGAHSVFPDASR